MNGLSTGKEDEVVRKNKPVWTVGTLQWKNGGRDGASGSHSERLVAEAGMWLWPHPQQIVERCACRRVLEWR